MTSENIAVTGPVKVVSDSPSRVAYELMNEIAHNEGKKSTEKTREYLLTLYRQCHKAVNGHQLESILDQKNWTYDIKPYGIWITLLNSYAINNELGTFMNPLEAISEASKSTLHKASSPLIGAFITSWLIINWKIIFILFMSKETIEKVVIFIETNLFNINEMFYYPLAFSAAYVIGSPWLNVATTWIMSEAEKHKAKIVLKREIEINQMMRDKSLTDPKLKFPYSEIEEIMATAIINMTPSEKRRFVNAVNATADESVKFGQF